jgi:hypothetical protein
MRYRLGTTLLLVAIVAIALAWRRDHQRLIAELKQYQNPGPQWEPIQATGAPDSLSPGDSSSAWCPATAEGGAEWLILDYGGSITPTSIVLHENYEPGAVVRVTHYPLIGRERTLWEGTYQPQVSPTGHIATLPVSTPLATTRIKVYLDTATIPGWNEIDAVGLVDSSGQVHWATAAKGSSTWNQGVAQSAVRSQIRTSMQP